MKKKNNNKNNKGEETTPFSSTCFSKELQAVLEIGAGSFVSDGQYGVKFFLSNNPKKDTVLLTFKEVGGLIKETGVFHIKGKQKTRDGQRNQ